MFAEAIPRLTKSWERFTVVFWAQEFKQKLEKRNAAARDRSGIADNDYPMTVEALAQGKALNTLIPRWARFSKQVNSK
jgi:hypothetical protein